MKEREGIIMRKKVIVSGILLLLLAGILLIRLGLRLQSSPDPASASSVLTDKSKPIKAKSNNKLELTGKKAVFKTYDGTLYMIQKDGTVDEFRHEKGHITDTYQSKSWLYYIVEDYDGTITTLYRAPIDQQGENTILLLKKQEQLKTDVFSIMYATDQYVIYDTSENTYAIAKYTVKSKKSERMEFASDEEYDITWSCIYGPNQEPIMEKNGDIYMREEIDDDFDGLANRICFYKFNVNTLQKTKLSDRTTAVLSDSSGQIVIMESDKTWNYAYYPETEKRIRCGQNMMKEWGTDGDLNCSDFDEDLRIDSLPPAANRDLVDWIREKNPWGYREKHGDFRCQNYFIYNDRMYVKVKFKWMYEPEAENEVDDYNGDEAYMLFSYSLKNYEGIRSETEINQIMKKYSRTTFNWIGDSGSYYYKVTGNFSFLLNDILVFEYNNFYVLYHLGTGEYRKIEGKNKDLLYLEELL